MTNNTTHTTNTTTNTNTTRTHTTPTATAEELVRRWEALVAEGDSTTQGISYEAQEALEGVTDYSEEIWEGNPDLTPSDEAMALALQMWLTRYPLDPNWDGE